MNFDEALKDIEEYNADAPLEILKLADDDGVTVAQYIARFSGKNPCT